MTQDIANQTCIFVSLMGAPNAGKSTLTNKMVGTKVSIVSPKVQTTRASIRGIALAGNAQIVLVDTPGVFVNPKRDLEKAIVQEAWDKGIGTDAIAVLVDAKKGMCKDTCFIIESLKKQKKQAILILNKVDLVSPQALLPLVKALDDTNVFSDTFMISALNGDGVADFKAHLAKIAPPSPWMYPEDQVSDAPMRFLAAEITREKLFLELQQELPYNVAVQTESWEETDKKVTIHQCIYTAKDGQKAIILGKGGQKIKRIGQTARHELSNILEKKVNLFLFVKVRENWLENPEIYREMGLDFPR